MEFKYAKKEDSDKVLELWKRTGVFVDWKDSSSLLEEIIEFDEKSIIIARQDDKIVGSAILICHPFQSFIYRLSIDPEYQGKGLGKKLVDRCVEEIQEHGMKYASGFIDEGNTAALRFFEKLGWDKHSRLHYFVKNIEDGENYKT